MPRPTRIAAAAAAAIALILLPASAAFAHASIDDSTPRDGEVLTSLPEQFTVRAGEGLLDLGGEGSGFVMIVRDADGLYYGDGCTEVDGDTMATPAVLGAPGEYTITWQLISADGHPLSGTIDFEWAPAGEFASVAGSPEPGACAAPGGVPDAASETPADSTEDPSSLPYWIAGGIGAAAIVGATVLVLANRAKRRD